MKSFGTARPHQATISKFSHGEHVRAPVSNAGVCPMNQILRLTIATMAIAFVNFPTTVPAQVAAAQIKLTENQIEGFIAAQKAMSAVLEKMQGTAFSDQAFAKYKAERDVVTKKHGFKDLAEYEAVATNIFIVIAGIDPETKVFTDPQTAIKKEIKAVRADKTIPNSEKKQLLEELDAALKSAQSIQFPTNIELVRKYYDIIDVTTIAAYDSDNPTTSSVVRTISE
jgi:hypothetical protein